MTDLPGGEELRALVRQVIKESLATSPNAPAGAVPLSTPPAVIEPVSLRNDADLLAFVHRVLDAAADPSTAAALRSGRIRFVLATGGGERPAAPDGVRVEKGAVTERHVKAAAESGGRLILGRGAVLTPLARDRARTAGVSIERES